MAHAKEYNLEIALGAAFKLHYTYLMRPGIANDGDWRIINQQPCNRFFGAFICDCATARVRELERPATPAIFRAGPTGRP
jgi:hypothetical protein